MKINYKQILVCVIFSILAVACGPKKEEKKQQPPPAQETNKLLSYPDNEVLKKEKEGQKPSEQEQELQIDEDNVMNPFPG